MVLIQHLDAIFEVKRTSNKSKDRYRAILSLLDGCTPSTPIFIEDLLAKLESSGTSSLDTFRKDCDQLIKNAIVVPGMRKEILDRIEGYLPPAEVVVDIVESLVSGSKIIGSNLSEANHICADYVTRGTFPRYERFVRDELQSYINTGGKIELGIDEMIDFLKNQYDPFAKRVANGLISRAGKLNEMLLERSLVNQGIGAGDYDMTGTKSVGDMVFYCRKTKPEKQLYAEIKSYAARERLLRGLQDLNGKPSIGVGFFNDASEFNPSRTQDFINTNVWGIYLPDETFSDLHEDSIARKSQYDQAFYRKLSDFPSDIRHFVQFGVLP